MDDHERSTGLEKLRAAVREGFDSGPSEKTIPSIMEEVEARFKARPHAFNFKPGVDADRLNQLADELEVEEFARKQVLAGEPPPDWQRDLIRDRLTALEDVPPEERSAPWEAIRKRLFAGKK